MNKGENIESCQQIADFFDVFYKPYLDNESLACELDKLRDQASKRPNRPKHLLALHVASLTPEKNHYEAIKSFLRWGKLGSIHHPSLSSTISPYMKMARLCNRHNLIVATTPELTDIYWQSSDRKGDSWGWPIKRYDENIYGQLPPELAWISEPTHIPPDRILGFYYIPE